MGLLMDRKKVIKFDSVCDEVHKLHDLNFRDQVVELDKLRIMPGLNIEVPNVGVLNMTDWSRGQLGSMLGVKWDKWFDPKIVQPAEMQEELQRRFSRTKEARLIRARRFKPGDPGVKGADGYLRGFLSPTYSPIDNVRVFDRLAKRFRNQVDELGFMRNHLGTDFYNDRASHFTVVGEPINMGPLDRKRPETKAIYDLAEREGKLPDGDWVYQGFHMRNSEVGYTALIIDGFTFRLVCLNGAIVTVKGGRMLYRVHRSIDEMGIDSLLDDTFRSLPSQYENNRKRMTVLQEQTLGGEEAVNDEIVKFLTKMEATKTFQEEVKEAFKAEPIPTRYGVWQAITRAAQNVRDMERRAALEEYAGTYLAQAA
jgi:hypothetical protein